MSEIGPVPEDWSTPALADVADCLDRLRVPLNYAQRQRMKGDIPYCGANGVLDHVSDFVIDDDVILMAEDGGFYDQYATRPIAYRIIGKCWVNNHAHVLKAKAGTNQGFLYYSLVHKNILPFLVSGTRAKLNKTEMEKIVVAAPPTEDEQKTIALTLSDIDSLLSALTKLIVKKRDLKQAAMQQLLTARTRLPGYHGDWKAKPLGELFTFSGGYPASRAQLSDAGYCYLHYGDVHAASKPYINVDLDRLDIPRLNVQLAGIPAGAMLKDGDVVFVDASEDEVGASKHIVVVNRCGIPFISGLHTIIAKSKSSELATEYRRYCFQTDAVREQFSFYIAGTKVFSISKGNIAKLLLFYPSDHAEQCSIAAVLADMDGEIEALKLRRDKVQNLKTAMMQELLTGRTRLVARELTDA